MVILMPNSTAHLPSEYMAEWLMLHLLRRRRHAVAAAPAAGHE
jgi:hypothetical protein